MYDTWIGDFFATLQANTPIQAKARALGLVSNFITNHQLYFKLLTLSLPHASNAVKPSTTNNVIKTNVMKSNMIGTNTSKANATRSKYNQNL